MKSAQRFTFLSLFPILILVHSRFLFVTLIFLRSIAALASVQCADTTVRIMSWNLLNFPSQSNLAADTTTRMPYYRKVLQYVNPDILVTQEVSGGNTIPIFLNGVMNSNSVQYSAGTFINGYDTDNGIFYRTSCFRFLSNTPIETDLRDVNIFTLVHLSSNDTIRILACHLKASSGVVNEGIRAAEADSIRKVTDAFPLGIDFMICGDFNFYGSYEPGYQRLLQVDSASGGNFNDVISMTGVWNDSAYSHYHTQSPRVRSFGGGATGGLDDRFDLMLFSASMIEPGRITYQPGTMTPVGNDGLHYGDSINRPPNAAVSQTIADALHYASDHLPVYADFDFAPVIGIEEISRTDISLKIFPNPSQHEVMLSCNLKNSGNVTVTVYDAFARVVKILHDENVVRGIYKRKIAGERELQSGNYFVRITSSAGESFSALFTAQ